jgi:hypothetical protein
MDSLLSSFRGDGNEMDSSGRADGLRANLRKLDNPHVMLIVELALMGLTREEMQDLRLGCINVKVRPVTISVGGAGNGASREIPVTQDASRVLSQCYLEEFRKDRFAGNQLRDDFDKIPFFNSTGEEFSKSFNAFVAGTRNFLAEHPPH